MGMDVARLENELVEMTRADAPGREFCAAIAELGRCGRLGELRSILPEIVCDELEARYAADREGFVAEWKQLAEEMQKRFVVHARQRLTSLTRIQRAKDGERGPAWMEIQRALDRGENDLLRAAFALELVEMVEPAVMRATHLRECVVAAPSSEEADRYLDEATRCYFLGLYTACAVMCRAVLEEAVKERLPAAMARAVKARYRNAPTLGNLLREVNDNLLATGIDAEFPRVANRVNDAGKRAVHEGLLTEDEARKCLENARRALQLLLK